jgi:hypothetical protein
MTAKLRLVDFLKEQQNPQHHVEAVPLTEALTTYKERLASHPHLKPRSKEYRLLCLQKLSVTWPDLISLSITDITPDLCFKWPPACVHNFLLSTTTMSPTPCVFS